MPDREQPDTTIILSLHNLEAHILWLLESFSGAKQVSQAASISRSSDHGRPSGPYPRRLGFSGLESYGSLGQSGPDGEMKLPHPPFGLSQISGSLTIGDAMGTTLVDIDLDRLYQHHPFSSLIKCVTFETTTGGGIENPEGDDGN